jgi:ATP-dependent RNA helicase DeaD
MSLVTPQEQWRLRRIEKFARQKISKFELPTIEDIQKHREEVLLGQMLVWLRRGRCSREREMVTNLIEEGGYDPLEIAAASLKLARAEEKQRPIERIGEVAANPRRNGNSRQGRRASTKQNGRAPGGNRSHEKGMIRLSLNAGRAQGIRPNDVVGQIAFHADIPGRTIGAIKIHDQQTLVDVPEQYVAQVLAKNGSYRVRKQLVTIATA